MNQVSHKLAATVFLLALLSACSDRSTDIADEPGNWPEDLVPPIQGATFSLSRNHLPGAPRNYRSGTHQGFDFFNGLTGRPLAENEPVVAVASGEIIRIDRDYEILQQAPLDYYSELAPEDGFVGEYALDRLRGCQVWIRHENGHVSRYAHLSEVNSELMPGDAVERGQPIGNIGNTGVPPSEDQPEPAPHLHFELWSPDSDHHLGQNSSPLEIHRQISRVFGPNALPRYARQAVEATENGEAAPDPYPPEPLPDTGFTADPPSEAAAGQAFAIPITWEGDDFRVEDFFAIFEGMALGVLDAGDGAWILGAAPQEFSGRETKLTIGAIDRYGQPLVGQRRLAIGPSSYDAPAPMETSNRVLDTYTQENQRREEERLRAATLASLQRSEALWDSAFQAPLEGNVVGDFGQRLVAGPLAPQFPRPGLLIEPIGESGNVMASNAGVVVLAEDLPIRGRTVAIEHGGGVISVYAHLDSFSVEPGERVGKSQTIGTIGQTGAIDQDLLRWEIQVAGIPSNPRGWLDKLLPSG